MESVIRNDTMIGAISRKDYNDYVTNLAQANINAEYIIKEIQTNDIDMKDFLFTLGCYEGETITVISILAENFVIAVKDARYSIDIDLAKSIII
jgi:ferrous iron transport protein A